VASTAYVTNWVTTSVTPVNLVSSMAGTPIAVGEKSWGVAITPDGKTAYVSVTEPNTVTPITVATNTAGTPIAVGKRPEKLAIAADGDTAYVGNWISGDGVTPINLATNTAGTPITVAGKPISIAIVPDQGPLAAFSASAAPAGAATTFNASASSDPDGTVASYAWSFGDGDGTTTSSPNVSHVYVSPGVYTATLTVTDNEGCSTQLIFTGQTASCNGSSAASMTQTVIVPAVPAPPPVVVTPPTPTLSSLSESAKTWREGTALASISKKSKKKKPPVGTTFSFALNEPASVTFTFTEPATGHKVGKRCVAQTTKNKHKPRCTRTLTAGTLTFSAHAGTNKVHFEGLISKHTKLKPGSYTLLVTATASGRHSTTGTLHFTIANG
jgi:DNA-binding beta-propeller fold protein YncE